MFMPVRKGPEEFWAAVSLQCAKMLSECSASIGKKDLLRFRRLSFAFHNLLLDQLVLAQAAAGSGTDLPLQLEKPWPGKVVKS